MVNKIENNNKKNIRIVQVTDTHLSEDPEASMLGLKPKESFADVVDLIRQQQSGVDCFLCTGDISQDASVSAYQQVNEVFQSFDSPYLWLPGNHDVYENIETAVGKDNPCLNKVVTIGNWQIIMLDSSVIGKTYGLLSPSELSFLDEALASSKAAELNVMVCVHHNPVPVQAQWLQNICLRNSSDLFAITDKYEHIKGVVFGHIHQKIEAERNGVQMLGAPSTCIQFHPDRNDFALDNINPGYRWLELTPAGEIITGVQRVEGKRYNIDFSSTGY